MSTLPPDWAIRRALDLIGRSVVHSPDKIRECPNVFREELAFARYIAEHENPPVDPDLEEARKIIADVTNNKQWLEPGHDGFWIVHAVLTALKRGRELTAP